jgi:hypothetical protein
MAGRTGSRRRKIAAIESDQAGSNRIVERRGSRERQ